MQLPHDLRTALELQLEAIPARELALATHELSRRYRERAEPAGPPLLRSAAEIAAYAAYRLPATFAAAAAILTEVARQRSGWEPRSLLDVGGGPGTAAWAALEVWPEIQQITILEREPRMIALGEHLARRAEAETLRSATWRRVDLSGPWEEPPADLTVAAYLLDELPEAKRADFVHRLWQHSTHTCVLIEPGTPAGSALIQETARALADQGARIIAPFPPEWKCVESATDWCHFAQRVPRSRLHRIVKDADLAYEDEKYAYIVASRQPGEPIAARVIRRPQVRSGHIRLTLCTGEGVKHLVVPHSNRAAYRRAKSLGWGSAISPEEAHLFGLAPEG